MDNATRRQLLEQTKQVGYTGSILDVFHNPQVLDQFVQEQQQTQQQPQLQQSQPQIEISTPPATTPNYKVPQTPQSEAQPLVMSNTEVPIQIRKNGGVKFDNGGPKEENTMSSEDIRNEWNKIASQNIKNLYAELDAEKERVAKVRTNIPIEANKLDEADNFRHTQGMGDDLRPYNNYLTAKNPKELEAARQSLSPKIKNLLINQGKYNVAQWDANKGAWNPQNTPGRELYCTPYGCYTYQLAGATDVPIVPGNMGFQAMVANGQLPFEKVTDPEQGDMGLIIGNSPRNYSKPELGTMDRAHHTVVYDSTGEDGSINAWNAYDGSRLNYMKSNFKLEPDVKDSPTKSMEYYRYIGNTKNIQKKLDAELKANPRLQELENQLKIQQELENKESLGRIQPLDIKPIRPTSQQLELASNKKYGGKKCYTCNQSKLQVLYNKRNYKK